MAGDARYKVDGWNRKWRTLWVWSQLYIGYKAAQARGKLLNEEQRKVYWEKKHSYLAENTWLNIAELRGWWVKVGQFLSTRSDLLPSQYITHLTKLQDMMPTSNFSVVSKVIETELGKPLQDVFSEFDEVALASASIAQVHKAKLKSTGDTVVVKVQHPNVDRTLKQDMVTLAQMTWAFGFLEKGLNFGPILDEWQKSAADELDFRLEMGYQMRARLAAERSGIDVIIPNCYPEYTTKRILVMEFCEGFKITDTDQLAKHSVDVDTLMNKICMSFAYQIHVDGLFNGDPHPGNILVQIDPKTKEARPVLLDWGLVKMFSTAAKIAFASAVYCVANMDVMGLMAAFEDMGFRFKANSPIDPEVYMDALRIGFFRDTGDTPTTEEKETAKEALKQSKVTKQTVIEKNPIDDWPKDIIFFIRVASLLHGLSLQLKARVPFLQLLVNQAERSLCERYIPVSPLVYICYPVGPSGKIRCALEWKIEKFLRHLLQQRDLLLGCQVAVFKDGRLVVDTCVGKMGPTDSRPVTRESLFCTMTAVNGLLVSALLKLIGEGELSLNDLVCHWWDGFIRFQKHNITVHDVLTHRAGMHRALSINLKLSQLMDYETMISLLEDAIPEEPRGTTGGQYAYMTSGWMLSEIVRGVTGMRIDQFINAQFIRKLNLQNELFFPVPKSRLQPSKSSSSVTPISTSISSSYSTTTTTTSPRLSPNNNNSSTLSSSVNKYPPEKLATINNTLVGKKDEIENGTGQRSKAYTDNRCLRSSRKISSETDNTIAPTKFLNNKSENAKKKFSKNVNTPITQSTTPVQPDVWVFEAQLDDILQHQIQIDSTINYQSSLQTVSANEKKGVLQEPSPKLPWLSGEKTQLVKKTTSSSSTPNLNATTNNLIIKSPVTTPLSDARMSTPKRLPRTATVDLGARLASSRRQIGVARIGEEEAQAKIDQVKRYMHQTKGSSRGLTAKYPSKHLHKLMKIQSSRLEANISPCIRCSALELARAKPHVMDPLIYDSRRILHALIPPTNCRTTARALARFYAALASGRIVGAELLTAAAAVELVDTSLDSLLLTGGGSRTWGLGYQLYPCRRLAPEEFKETESSQSSTSRKVTFGGPGKTETQQRSSAYHSTVVGLGHGDISGSVAFCIPELNLSIAVLLNDILAGPIASREIVTFVLKCFGLEPTWYLRYPMNDGLRDLQASVASYSVSKTSVATAILQKETEFLDVSQKKVSSHSVTLAATTTKSG